MARVLLWSGNAVSLLMLLVTLQRAYTTDCGHSGAADVFFIPHVIWGVGTLWFKRYGVSAKVGAALGCCGAVATPYLAWTDLLRGYDSWIRAGMPDPPAAEDRVALVFGYGAGCVALLVLVGALALRSRARSYASDAA